MKISTVKQLYIVSQNVFYSQCGDSVKKWMEMEFRNVNEYLNFME